MKKNKGILIIIIIAVLLILVSGGYLIREYLIREQADAVYQQVQDDVTRLDEQAVGVETADFSYLLMDGKIPVDFGKLQSINPDLVAWIQVPNTAIDYPVAYYDGEDQFYYLNHNMYREEQFAGCIFMQNVNEPDFSEYNTVLYGHNMRNGSMFAALHKFEDQEFFDANRYIYIYLPDRIYVYEIFAAYLTDDTNINALYDFSNPTAYEQYIADLYQGLATDGILSSDVEVTKEKNMITLSTCSSRSEDRFLVQGILTAVVTESAQ